MTLTEANKPSKEALELAAEFLGDWIGEYDESESRWIRCRFFLARLIDSERQETRNEIVDFVFKNWNDKVSVAIVDAIRAIGREQAVQQERKAK